VFEALKAQKLETEIKRDEEHSTWTVTFKDPRTQNVIGVELASQAEYKRLARSQANRQVQFAAVRVMRDERRETQPGWRELLNHVKSEGTREVNVQRYKVWAR